MRGFCREAVTFLLFVVVAACGGAEPPAEAPRGSGPVLVKLDGTCWDGSAPGDDACKQGLCGNPIDLPLAAGEKAHLEGAFQPMQAGEACGVAGQEMIFRLVAPEDGVMVIDSSAAFASSISIRSQCDAPGSELACKSESGLRVLSTAVVSGQPIFVALAAEDDSASGRFFRIATQVNPFRGTGETCSDMLTEQCAPGSNCLHSNGWRCVQSLVPSELEVVQGGPTDTDLFLRYASSGPHLGNAHAEIRIVDTLGGERDLEVAQHRPTSPEETVQHHSRLLPGALSPGSAPVSLFVRLSNGGWGPAVGTTAFAKQPVVALGQACDPTYTENRCEPSDACLDAGAQSVCLPLAEARRSHWQQAASVDFGETISVEATGRGIWEIPDFCELTQPMPNSRSHPEQIVRLHLDRERSSVHILVSNRGLPVVAFYAYGDDGELVAIDCAEYGLSLPPVLPRGDYLIVIKERSPGNQWSDAEYSVWATADD